MLDRALWHDGESDEAQLRDLIEKHFQFTGSIRAKSLLENWDAGRGTLSSGPSRSTTSAPWRTRLEGRQAGARGLSRGARYRYKGGRRGPRESDKHDDSPRSATAGSSPIRIENRMGKATGFLEFERRNETYEPSQTRVKHYKDSSSRCRTKTRRSRAHAA